MDKMLTILCLQALRIGQNGDFNCSNSQVDIFSTFWGREPCEERRKPFHGGLTAASDRQGWRKCRFCMEQKSALLPTSSKSSPCPFYSPNWELLF